MLALPRAALLVMWTNAWLAGGVSLDTAVSRITGADEPHAIEDVPGATGPVGIAELLGWLRRAGADRLQLALPVPGDPLGLAGPPAFNEAALQRGEAVIVSGIPGGILPEVRSFGAPDDEGHEVTWGWYDSAAGPPDLPTVSEANHALSLSVLHASRELERLDAATWGNATVELLKDLRGGPDYSLLPASLPQPAHALVGRALQQIVVVVLGQADDGSALTATAASTRREVLRDLGRTARQALMVGCSATSLAGDRSAPPGPRHRPPTR